MSDGPHRTLPMRKGWKELARRADRRAFDVDDMCDALIPALADDWKHEVGADVLKTLHAIVGDSPQQSLFVEPIIAQLEALRPDAISSPMTRSLVDCLIVAHLDGHSGAAAMLKATQDVLTERALGGARQTEEHYLRDPRHGGASFVRGRIEQAIEKAAIGSLAQSLCRAPRISVPRVTVHDGLDEGVRLP